MDRVAVFIDYENMHRCARNEFGGMGHFDPWLLGERLVQRRAEDPRTNPSQLNQVRVYRGLPDPRKEPKANAANQTQATTWRERAASPDRLFLYQRPLRYPKGWPDTAKAQEKGVDVALAVQLVQLTYQGAMDVAIVCSHDTDLAPALDVVASVRTAKVHLEVASWATAKRISLSGLPNQPWCHRLDRAFFDSVRDDTTYVEHI